MPPQQVELARWLGPDAMRTMLFDKLRDAIREELNRHYEGLELSRKPPRLTRKQKAKAVEVQDHAVVGNGAASNEASAAVVAEDKPPPEVCSGVTLPYVHQGKDGDLVTRCFLKGRVHS